MRRRRRLGSRSKRYRRRWPSIAGWSLGVLAGIGALAAVGYVHGNPYDVKSESFSTALHVALARPAVSAALGFGGLLLIAWSARHLTLEALSWWPGKVVVEDFTAGPEIEDANVARLTAAFRNRLAESHLQAPASVPAAAPQGNFIDVLSGGGTEPGALLSTLAGLLRAALPDHAYEVKGVLVTREQEPRCGVTVQVERLPGQAGPAQTFWRSSWDRAIVRAADHATASIVPRTRRCHAPWAGWRGYHLPSRLVHNYERAAELEAERRFDEALDAYYDALKDDPMNLCLRLQIGFLQEKLALFLDAFATYEGILAVAQPGRAKENDGRSAKARAKVPRPRRARRHGVDRLGSTYRGAARRDREQVLLVAHYRRTILLAGSEFPRQWRRGAAGKPNLRDKQRTQLRERLRPRLEHELAKAGGSTPTRTEVEEMLAEPARTRAGTPVSASESATQLDLACLQAASASFGELEHLTPTWSLRRSTALTRSTVKLSSLWTAQRLQRVHAELGQVEGGHADVSQLTGKIKEIEKHAHGFRRWQDHYNAACVYSLPLLAGASTDADADEHARLAVDYLERAIGCADSGFVALHRDWVLADDPDLEGLREHRRFKQFEAMFFPSPARTRTRPPGLHRWELSHYTIDLLCSTADRWEGLWESRRTDLGASPAPHELLDWCELEADAWDRVQDVAYNHRHWRTRVKLIEQVDAAAQRHGFAPLEAAFPRFADATGLGDAPDLDARVLENDRRLRALSATSAAKRDHACRLIADLQLRRASLGLIDQPGWTARKADVARICDAHAALWRTLRRCLTDERVDVPRFARAIEAAGSAWLDAEAGWPVRGSGPARRRRGQQPHSGRRRRSNVRS
ncbi:MAG TPA: hypothetical protein VFB44_11995 [Thermoleophilaceae bacterium]|nr:hypothetical protein [Thermoleophilaceae bacterium]